MSPERPVVIIDTGFLFDLVIWRMTLDALDEPKGAPPEAFRGQARRIQTQPRFEEYVDVLRRYRVVTWTGLLVELRYLCRPSAGRQPERVPEPRFWRAWKSLRPPDPEA